MNKTEEHKTGQLTFTNGIGILKLVSPPHNYLDNPEFICLNEIKKVVEASETRGLIITGAGRHFSAGADLTSLFDLAENENTLQKKMEQGLNLLDFIEKLEIPVVSAITGVCFGGGLEIALSAHIRICSPKALFAFPETNNGLIPGIGGIIRAQEITSKNHALKMVLGGDILNAEEALEMKLVDHISDDPFTTAMEWVKKMTTDKPVKVIRFVMRAFRNASEMTREAAMKEETRMFCELAVEEAQRRSI